MFGYEIRLDRAGQWKWIIGVFLVSMLFFGVSSQASASHVEVQFQVKDTSNVTVSNAYIQVYDKARNPGSATVTEYVYNSGTGLYQHYESYFASGSIYEYYVIAPGYKPVVNTSYTSTGTMPIVVTLEPETGSEETVAFTGTMKEIIYRSIYGSENFGNHYNAATPIRKHALAALLELRGAHQSGDDLSLDLNGLQHAANLKTMYLGGYALTNVSFIPQLKELRSITINYSNITTLQPFVQLLNTEAKLKELYMDGIQFDRYHPDHLENYFKLANSEVLDWLELRSDDYDAYRPSLIEGYFETVSRTANSIRVQIPFFENVSYYEIRVFRDMGEATELVKVVTPIPMDQSEYVISGLAPDMDYMLRLQAVRQMSVDGITRLYYSEPEEEYSYTYESLPIFLDVDLEEGKIAGRVRWTEGVPATGVTEYALFLTNNIEATTLPSGAMVGSPVSRVEGQIKYHIDITSSITVDSNQYLVIGQKINGVWNRYMSIVYPDKGPNEAFYYLFILAFHSYPEIPTHLDVSSVIKLNAAQPDLIHGDHFTSKEMSVFLQLLPAKFTEGHKLPPLLS